jgi:DNA-binding response OmpR family regulator
VAVDEAANGEQAMTYLERARFDEGALPQLVLLDLKLPRLDGFEVLRRIRAEVQQVATLWARASA